MDGPLVRADLHNHTFYSNDSITSPQRFVRECQRRGIDRPAVTDHNTIKGALAVKEIAPFPVVVGEEVRSKSGEILGLFLSEEVPAGRPAEETVARIKEQGGLVGVPHPFDQLRSPLLFDSLMALIQQVDFIEGFNARVTFRKDNRRAMDFAREHGIAVTAASDSHSPGEVGRAWLEMPDFDDAQSFLASLPMGQVCGGVSSPLIHFVSRWSVLRRKLGWRPV